MNTIEESIAQAFQLHRQGDLEAANSRYLALIGTSPDHPALNYLLGTLRYQVGDLANAASLLRKATELDPYNAQAHANLSLVLQDIGQLDSALTCCENAISLDPD